MYSSPTPPLLRDRQNEKKHQRETVSHYRQSEMKRLTERERRIWGREGDRWRDTVGERKGETDDRRRWRERDRERQM